MESSWFQVWSFPSDGVANMAVKGLKHFTYVYQNSVKHIYTQMEKIFFFFLIL